ERLAQAAYTAGLTEPGVSNTIRSAKDGAKGRTKP
ncbi:MAG: Bifunctional DNA primase/polymerase, partial [Actinomyces urogenitalis DORA_12]